MKRRYYVWAAVIMAFALIVAACGDSDSASDETTTTAAQETTTTTQAATTTTAAETTTTVPAELPTLVIWADNNRAPVVTEGAKAFTEATGVEIQVDIVDFGDMRTEVSTKGPAGEGPDIFLGAHDWLGEMVADGSVAAIDLGNRAGDFTEPSLVATALNGEQYGMPYATEAIAMYYNPDLVAEPPATMAELTAACDDLDASISCLVLPGGNDAGDAYHNQPFITAAGGQLFAYDATAGFDGSTVVIGSEETIEGATLLETLVTDGYVPSTNYGDAATLFKAGEAAFWITGPWERASLDNPDENTGAPNWAVTTLPTYNGNPMQPHVGIQAFYLSAYSENAAIAQEFLLNYVATPDVMLALYNADPRGSSFKATINEIAGDPVQAVFSESIAIGTFMPNIPEMGAVWTPVGDNFLLLRNGELDAATAMTNAQEAVEAAIAGG
jgi:maltose-binding protein MalE